MKTSILLACATVAAAMALGLAACSNAVKDPKYERNPNPRQRYVVTAKVDGAPGAFRIVLAGVQYVIGPSQQCMPPAEPISGTFPTPKWANVSPQVRKVSESEFEFDVYLDAMAAKDYFGRGVCTWQVEGVTMSLRPTGVEGERTFTANLDASDVTGKAPLVLYARREMYGAPRKHEYDTVERAIKKTACDFLVRKRSFEVLHHNFQRQGVRPVTISSTHYAELSEVAYTPPALGADGSRQTKIGGVAYNVVEIVDNKSSGYQGLILQREDTKEIVVAHRGTEFTDEFIDDVLRADGGMVATRLNHQAKDALELTRKAMELGQVQGVPVTVTGHSLGGCLAQITAAKLGLHGETFNAYGAASLGMRIPEGGRDVVNHVMAADFVSSASHHYGEVRVYASRPRPSGRHACRPHGTACGNAMRRCWSGRQRRGRSAPLCGNSFQS